VNTADETMIRRTVRTSLRGCPSPPGND